MDSKTGKKASAVVAKGGKQAPAATKTPTTCQSKPISPHRSMLAMAASSYSSASSRKFPTLKGLMSCNSVLGARACLLWLPGNIAEKLLTCPDVSRVFRSLLQARWPSCCLHSHHPSTPGSSSPDLKNLGYSEYSQPVSGKASRCTRSSQMRHS